MPQMQNQLKYWPLSLLKVNHRCWNKKAMITSCCTNSGDIKVCPAWIGLLNCLVHVACASLMQNYANWHIEKIPHTWGISLTLWRRALYDSGLAMKAMPAEREMSFSPDLCFMCSAEKFPSMMNVRTSSFLLYEVGRSFYIKWWWTVDIWLPNHLEELGVVLLSGGFTFQIVLQEIVQDWECEHCLDGFESHRKQSTPEQLLIIMIIRGGVTTHTKDHFKNTILIDDSQHGIARWRCIWFDGHMLCRVCICLYIVKKTVKDDQ